MGNWKIVVPEAATNLLLNPSLEIDATGWSMNDGTLTRSTDFARFGYACGKIVGDGVGGHLPRAYSPSVGAVTLAATAGSSYTFAVYLKSTGALTATITLRWVTGAGAFVAETTSDVAVTTSWARYTLTATAPATTGAVSVGIREPVASSATLYFDGAQFEAASYATTYIDGDQPGGTWSGLRHLSASSRPANYRLGGREYDIQTQYGLRVRQFSGAGVPDYELMTQELALQPGAVFLRDKINARTLTLTLDNNSTSAAGLHSKRKAFWNVIKPDALGQSQPFLIGYSGAASGKTVYGAFRYAGGWGLNDGINGGANFVEAGGTVGLRLLAVDPFWYADDQETAALDFQDSIASNNYALARIGGAWQNLGTGFSGPAWATSVDKERGRVYYGGNFATANGVTVNGICYWNGTTFVAMGGTPGVTGGTYRVKSIAVAPNGDVWIGGDFTAVGGVTADGLARWNIATSTWTAFTNGTPGDTIEAIAIDKNGLVYIGGTFLNWDGNANEDNIASYNGTAFAPLSTGANSTVYALAIGIDGTTLYVGGDFTTPQTRLMTWNGSAFAAMSGGASSFVTSITVVENGDVYVGGAFVSTPTATQIARWNGSSWIALGSGVNDVVRKILSLGNGVILVCGDFTTAGGSAISERLAYWNGSAWYQADADLPGAPITNSASLLNGNIYISYDTTGTATVAGRTTVTVLSTASIYPIITITGTTTAASTSTLQWLENQTTGERLYFNLTINTGEIITIDLRPQARKVTSNWRGQIFDQPLPTSDYSAWHLVTGANTIAAFMTGTITGVTMVMNWPKIHASIDGEAA